MLHPDIKLGLGLIGIGRQWGHAAIQVPEETDVLEFLKGAYELGIDFFDTAASYGSSEERLGKFLRTLNPGQRERISVSTKFGDHWDGRAGNSYVDHSFDALVASLDRSLSRLGKIDVLQLHKTTPQALKSDDLKRALDYARGKGVTRFGASVSDLESGRMVCESDVFSIIQCPYNAENAKFGEIIDLAEEKHKLVLTNRPFGMGKMLYNENQEVLDKKTRQIEAYKFILRKKFHGFILSGTKSLEHLRENIEAFRLAYFNKR
ncbi:MAG: aldo/keto reductase [Thermoguttaceae bacterium]|jgi:aryl-alcohol dehydrogenase-like predicted oxidoreductase